MGYNIIISISSLPSGRGNACRAFYGERESIEDGVWNLQTQLESTRVTLIVDSDN